MGTAGCPWGHQACACKHTRAPWECVRGGAHICQAACVTQPWTRWGYSRSAQGGPCCLDSPVETMGDSHTGSHTGGRPPRPSQGDGVQAQQRPCSRIPQPAGGPGPGAEAAWGLWGGLGTYGEAREALGAVSRGAVFTLGAEHLHCLCGRQGARRVPSALLPACGGSLPRRPVPPQDWLRSSHWEPIWTPPVGHKPPGSSPSPEITQARASGRLDSSPHGCALDTHPLAHQPRVSRGASGSWGSSETLRRGRVTARSHNAGPEQSTPEGTRVGAEQEQSPPGQAVLSLRDWRWVDTWGWLLWVGQVLTSDPGGPSSPRYPLGPMGPASP